MKSSLLRELLKLTDKPEIISFAGGLPAPELFPIEVVERAASKVLREQGSRALQYSTTEGYRPLREFIVERMSRYGIPANADNVLITTGSQQALDMIGKILINPGDCVLTEDPTYLGALQAWRAYQADFVTVPLDDEGLRCDDSLDQALSAGPKFMYLLPNFHNPGGVTMSLERRKHIVEVADQYGIPIIEDDPYGQLRFEGDHLPPLLVLDAERLEQRGHGNGNGDGYFRNGNVIYLSTFSKTLAPGLRLGWIVAPESVLRRCVMAKQGMDLHSSTFDQMVAYEVVRDGFIDEHVQQIRRVYSERRDLMLQMLERYFPPEARWTRPQGGLFLWVTLPEGVDTAELLTTAVEHNVAFVPGVAFHPGGGPSSSFRLNFSSSTPEKIEVGMRRLGEVVAQALEQRRAPVPA